MADSDELDARRRVLVSIDDDADREAVMAVFRRVDWRRHMEAMRGAGVPPRVIDSVARREHERPDWERFGLIDSDES